MTADPTTINRNAASARHAARRDSWVTKTDLARFLRCPYAFYQLSRGTIVPADLVDDLGARLIDDGVRFEQAVAGAIPTPPDLDLSALFSSDATLVGLPVLEHPGLRLRGTPDAVIADAGALIPVEIKSHKDLRRSDEIELAFYWLLLDAHRTRQVTPWGRIILRRGGEPVEVDVPISEALLCDARNLVDAVRACRRQGAKPRVCGCVACRGPLREAIERATRDGRDLTLLWGVGRKFAAALEAAGVTDYEVLLQWDPLILSVRLREAAWSVSQSMIERWQQHARSYLLAGPVFFAPPLDIGEFIALDLEYNPVSSHVWLAGVHVIHCHRRDEHVLWADTPSEEQSLLTGIARIVASHPGLPIITWAGTSADVAMLRHAAARLGQDLVADQIAERHVDAFQHAANSWRLPIPAFSLSTLATYFAVPKLSDVANGLDAQFLYDRYRASSDRAKRAAIKQRLVNYNRDDLLALAGVLQSVAALADS